MQLLSAVTIIDLLGKITDFYIIKHDFVKMKTVPQSTKYYTITAITIAAFMALCFAPGAKNQLLATYSSVKEGPDSVYIPINRAGRLLMIEARIDGEVGNLLFDTGASEIVLNKTYFRNHIIHDNISPNGITGPVGEADKIIIDELTLAGLSYKRVSANMANLGHIENRRGVKVLGLVGLSLFKDFEIIIDINNGALYLHKIDKKGERTNSKSAFKPDYSQKVEISHNIVFLKATIGGKNLRFCFDTGAESNALSTYSPREVLQTVTITRKSNLSGAGSQTNQVFFGSMNDFMLGSHKLTNMETILTKLDHLTEAYGKRIDGMLGYNFLIKGIICINFEKKQFSVSFTQAENL